MKQAKATKFFQIYTGNKCNLKTTGAGVYMLKEGSKIVYVGYSGNDVKKTMYRHFQTWNDLRTSYTKKIEAYARITYSGKPRNNYTAKVIFTRTAKDAALIEEFLINKFKPRDNSLKIDLMSKSQKREVDEVLNDLVPFSISNEDAPF